MTELQFSDPYQLAKYIKEANKQTPVKVYLNGDLSTCSSETLKIFWGWLLLLYCWRQSRSS